MTITRTGVIRVMRTEQNCPHCQKPTDVSSSGYCLECGHPIRAAAVPAWQVGLGPIKQYFSDLYEITSRPTRFFRRMPTTGGVSGPLAFALVTHWLGSALEFLWHSLIGGTAVRYVNDLMKMAGDVADVDNPGKSAQLFQIRDQLMHWIWGAGSVIVDPFFTLLSILFTTLFVFAAARIFVSPGREGSPREITYESSLRIVCYGLSPSILAGIPLAGSFIAGLLTAIVTVVGAREVYRINLGRAIVVALFPKILFWGTLMLGMFFALLAVLKLVASAF